jgi:peptidoglycan/LPS O-acetylase OafA/YrhL
MNDDTKSPLIQDPTRPGPSGHHYPALDGLRGVAILLVLLFHGFLDLTWEMPSNAALASWPKIGWVGVDIFFVLSGFLITGILIDTRESPRYFRNFYMRRFLRILPVYYLFLAVVFFVLPWFFSFDSEGLKTIYSRQAWLWTHLTNMSFVFYGKVWTGADWLNLTHLWSLAIEEQFYVLWPLVVFLLGRQKLKVACLVFIAAPFLLRLVLWQLELRNGALYFPTPCRVDGLAMGALVAILIRETAGRPTHIRFARAFGVVAVAMLAVLFTARGGIVFTDKPTVVFGTSFVSVLTACVILLVCRPSPSTWLAVPLQAGFLRMTGKVSYGLYLFHLPILAPIMALVPPKLLVRAVGSELSGNVLFVAIYIASSYALAMLSWYAYERHWLKLKRYFHDKPEGNGVHAAG